MWILCAGPGGSYTNTPAGPDLQAGIWMSSTGRNTEENLWAVNSPLPPGTCEFFSLISAFHDLRTPYINPCAYYLFSLLRALKHPMYKI